MSFLKKNVANEDSLNFRYFEPSNFMLNLSLLPHSNVSAKRQFSQQKPSWKIVEEWKLRILLCMSTGLFLEVLHWWMAGSSYQC